MSGDKVQLVILSVVLLLNIYLAYLRRKDRFGRLRIIVVAIVAVIFVIMLLGQFVSQ